MTSEGLGGVFEGDSADTCALISAHIDGGLSGWSRVRRPGSEDPHRRERKFISYFLKTFPFASIFRCLHSKYSICSSFRHSFSLLILNDLVWLCLVLSLVANICYSFDYFILNPICFGLNCQVLLWDKHHTECEEL